MAVANYESREGHLPPAYVADASGKPMHSWRVLLLPYIDQQELYEQYDFSLPWNSEKNLKLAPRMPRLYAFSGEYYPGVVMTNYFAVVGKETAWPGATGKKLDEIGDEHSSTILFVENAGEQVHWMEPRDLTFEGMSFQVGNSRGISSPYEKSGVAMVDGSLRMLERGVSEEVVRGMLTANGGEEITDEGNGWRIMLDGRDRKRGSKQQ